MATLFKPFSTRAKNKTLQQIVDTYRIPVMIIPKLNPGYYDQILDKGLSFDSATQKDKGLKLIARQAVKVFIDNSHSSLASSLTALGGPAAEVAKKHNNGSK